MDAPLEISLPSICAMGTQVFEPRWAESMHMPARMELLHVLNGKLTLHFAHEQFIATTGETLVVPSGVVHRDDCEPEGGQSIFFCSVNWGFEPDFFAVVDNHLLQRLPPDRKSELSVLFDPLRTDLAGGGAVDQWVAQARLLTILMLIYRGCAALRVAPGTQPGGARGPACGTRRRQWLDAAKGFLARHYAEPVGLDDVADALGISSFYLSRVFSEESDFSLYAYLTQLRLDRAKALLREGELTVAEVAHAVGYEDPNYFSKVFRRHTGVRPRDY